MTAPVSSGGFLPALLTFIFILAKVFAVAPIAAWSWWWVFSPMLVCWGIAAAIGTIGIVLVGTLALLAWVFEK